MPPMTLRPLTRLHRRFAAPPHRMNDGEAENQPHFIFEYLKFGELLAKIGIVTLSLIDQTISW